MKNELNYYYNLNPLIIRHFKDRYCFEYNKEYYSLIEITKNMDIEKAYNISIDLNNKGIYTHQFVLNSSNNIITTINNINYVLLKSNRKYDQQITINDLISFSNNTVGIINSKYTRSNWYDLWINKMDYFEYQIDSFKKKYPLIKESFEYYSGIVETGISMLVNEKNNGYLLCICHNRINKDTSLFELYNPLNFMIDVRVRDVAEYFKSSIDENTYNQVIEYLNYNNLNTDEIKLFFIRMIYPSFYFDEIEKIFLDSNYKSKLKKIIDKNNIYEKLIKKIYVYIKQTYTIEDIEWLNIK